MEDAKKQVVKLTRREFLAKAGSIGIGTALLPSISLWGESVFAQEVATTKAPPKYPWGYQKIDPTVAANLAYENWYKDFCSYATVSGILIPLQETMGEPYSSLPLEAFRFGHGGVVGWGTICGVLFGAGIAISFIAGREGDNILNELMYWYCETALPDYMPPTPKSEIKNVTVSQSPLCHISVGRWMKKEGVGLFSPQRKERCARLAASTAQKAVTLLNTWADGNFKPEHKLPVKMYSMTTQHNCFDCHGLEIPNIP